MHQKSTCLHGGGVGPVGSSRLTHKTRVTDPGALKPYARRTVMMGIQREEGSSYNQGDMVNSVNTGLAQNGLKMLFNQYWTYFQWVSTTGQKVIKKWSRNGIGMPAARPWSIKIVFKWSKNGLNMVFDQIEIPKGVAAAFVWVGGRRPPSI